MVTVIKKGTPKEEIRRKIKEAVESAPKKSIKKFAGTLNLKIDPLDYQITMRNEWELPYRKRSDKIYSIYNPTI